VDFSDRDSNQVNPVRKFQIMRKNNSIILLFCLVIVPSTALPFERFANYTSTLTVNDFAFSDDTVWAATSGGLFRYVRSTGSGLLFSNPSFFPDPAISAVCVDAKKNLWAASKKGFLTLRQSKGKTASFSNYAASGWTVTDIASYGKYLIIASEKGCSVFDTDKKTAVKNATGFTRFFLDPIVNTIAIYHDKNQRDTVLVLGCQKGVARLSLINDNIEKANFYDPSIWSIDTSLGMPVKSFTFRNDSLLALTTPGAVVNNVLVTGVNDSSYGDLYIDTLRKATLPSIITSVAVSPANECFVGTKLNYFYLWDGKDVVNVPIEGPAFTNCLRIYVDREGLTWVLPPITSLVPSNPWWEGISVLKNGKWQLYSPMKYTSMGPMYGNAGFTGVTEDKFGNLWFGTPGGQVKFFNKTDGSWAKYCVGIQSWGLGEFFRSTTCYPPDWAKCDAVVSDSSGYLWIANFYNFSGCLLAYDPAYAPIPTATDNESRHYRYFFPQNDANWSHHISVMCVDVAGNILVCDGSEGAGRIQIFRHNGNPLRNGLQHVADSNGFGTTFDAAATQDTLTYIATTNGFFTYSAPGNIFRKGLCVRSWVGAYPSLTIVDSTLTEVKTVEVEDERILWLGTVSSGLIRYDFLDNTSTVIDESSGLLSNHIQDLSIDRKNGYLWIATDRGVSRYSIGYPVDHKNTGRTQVYPNPYSKRRHLESGYDVVFAKLLPKSTVQVYSVNGALVTTLLPVETGTNGSVCTWKPARSTVPGMYLYSIRSSGTIRQGKLIITP
jgi:hypothetical protein